jgi:hypothetical protein
MAKSRDKRGREEKKKKTPQKPAAPVQPLAPPLTLKRPAGPGPTPL